MGTHRERSLRCLALFANLSNEDERTRGRETKRDTQGGKRASDETARGLEGCRRAQSSRKCRAMSEENTSHRLHTLDAIAGAWCICC
jgi:hypothetical protein